MREYAITPGKLRFAADESEWQAEVRDLAETCGRLVHSGIERVMVREPNLPAGRLVDAVRAVVASCGAQRVVVARRVDVAKACGAGGVHLSGAVGELRVAEVRRLMGAGCWVSVACHTAEETRKAKEGGADAVVFGPVFGKVVNGTKVMAGVGAGALDEACRAAGGMAVFALGGVDAGRDPECARAGAAGVAGIRRYFGGAER